MSLNVYVVGAGICGLSSAVCLSECIPDCNITVISNIYHPNTTSDHGFGIVVLRAMDFTDDPANVLSYVKETVNYCRQLTKKQLNEMGIHLVPSVIIGNVETVFHEMQTKFWQETGQDVRIATDDEVHDLGISWSKLPRCFERGIDMKNVVAYVGHHYVIDTSLYLPWLKKKLESLKHKDGRRRVEFVSERLSRFSDLKSCDLIVNCSGLGAADLACDPQVVPIRGQYLSVEAPDQNRLLLLNHTYIVPRFNDVAIGSVYQFGQTSCTTNPDDTEDILRRAEVGFPGIRRAKVRRNDVGIRPGRIGGPRVELEIKRLSRNKEVPVIHNYGHGPRGIAQHWGCASKVARLAFSFLQATKPKL